MMKKLFSTYSILVAVGVFIIVVIVSMWLKGSLSQKEENSVASSLSAVSQTTSDGCGFRDESRVGAIHELRHESGSRPVRSRIPKKI